MGLENLEFRFWSLEEYSELCDKQSKDHNSYRLKNGNDFLSSDIATLKNEFKKQSFTLHSLYYVLAFLWAITFTSSAFACDIDDIKFGKSADQLDVSSAVEAPPSSMKRVFDIPVRAKDICNKLPNSLRSIMTFASNKLTSVTLYSRDASLPILQNFKEDLGKPDNEKKLGETSNIPQYYIWSKDDYVAVYNAVLKDKIIYEKLSITSHKFGKEASKASLKEEK